jgi:glycosyltransferase involved in cell wall biosynthesis
LVPGGIVAIAGAGASRNTIGPSLTKVRQCNRRMWSLQLSIERQSLMSSFDVIIPCYNYGCYLADCARSVLTQSGVEIRVLILDDASTDSTSDVARKLAEQDSRVVYRRHALNHGHIATYNEGFAWASSNFVMLLSADDLLAPGALGRAALVMDVQPDVGLVYGRQAFFTASPPAVTAPHDPHFMCSVHAGATYVETACGTASNPMTTATAMMRTALLHSIGGFDTALPHTADMEMWLRLASRSSVAWIDSLQAFKRRHQSNMQHQYLTTVLGDLRERCAAFMSFFEKDGDLLNERDRLYALARNRLGDEAFWAASSTFDCGDSTFCEQCLNYALQLNPALCGQPMWARLRWKRRLGPNLWSVVRPMVEQFRGTTRRAAFTTS